MKPFEQLFPVGTENNEDSNHFSGKRYEAQLTSQSINSKNITLEPGVRSRWHKIQGDAKNGKVLLCTAGSGWFQIDGKKAKSVNPGTVVVVPVEQLHWYGAKADSWFSFIQIELAGYGADVFWGDVIDEATYSNLKGDSAKQVNLEFLRVIGSKKEFKKLNIFGTGIWNIFFAKYFTGKSYLKVLAMPKKSPVFLANVSFEPTCRNNWHIHHKGGQILYCTAGSGWYQEKGKPAQKLYPGDVVFIPAEVEHWHGAAADSWFSHIALSIPAEGASNEWLSTVSDEEFRSLK